MWSTACRQPAAATGPQTLLVSSGDVFASVPRVVEKSQVFKKESTTTAEESENRAYHARREEDQTPARQRCRARAQYGYFGMPGPPNAEV